MEELLRAIREVDDELRLRINELEEAGEETRKGKYKERYIAIGRIQGLEEASAYINKYVLEVFDREGRG